MAEAESQLEGDGKESRDKKYENIKAKDDKDEKDDKGKWQSDFKVSSTKLKFLAVSATEEQALGMMTMHSLAWTGPLSLKSYLDRQKGMRNLRLSKEGGLKWWIMIASGDPDLIVSSCATHLRDIVVASPDGAKPAKAVMISHLFTLPEYRMNGFASSLMGLLQPYFDSLGDNVPLSIIYGNDNTAFLEKLGWVPYPADQLRVTLGKPAEQLIQKLGNHGTHEQLNLLGRHDTEKIIRSDIQMTKFRASAKRNKADGPCFRFLPSWNVYDWHQARCSGFYTVYNSDRSKLTGDTSQQDALETCICGATFTDEDTGKWASAWWVHNFRERRLYLCKFILSRRQGLEEHLKLILRAAIFEALRWKLREVIAWDPTTPGLASVATELAEELGHGTRAVVEERFDALPYLRWRKGAKCHVDWDRQHEAFCETWNC